MYQPGKGGNVITNYVHPGETGNQKVFPDEIHSKPSQDFLFIFSQKQNLNLHHPEL